MPSSPPDDSVKLFLSYAREDFETVSALYDRLEGLGLRPWMDKRDLLAGQRWREIIPRQVQQSDLVLVCLSPQSVDKRGFFQREIRVALDAWKDKLQADIYLIPVRLAVCEVPEEVGEFNWVNLYEKDGWKLLLRAIEAAARSIGRPVPIELAEALGRNEDQTPSSGAKEPVARELRPRRIDAAAPSSAKVSELIDLLIQVRFPDSRLLGIEEWPTARVPQDLEQQSHKLNLPFPKDRATGTLWPTRLIVEVTSSGFRIEGRNRQLIDVPPHEFSPRVVFQLRGMRPGLQRINIEFHRPQDDGYLGAIPVETEVSESAMHRTLRVASMILGVGVLDDHAIKREKTAARMEHIEAQLAVDNLEREWGKAVGETWDLGTLDALLSRAMITADQGDVTRWEAKIATLREQLETLEKFFPRLEAAWNQEKFEEILTLCAELENSLNQARSALKENGLEIPVHYVKLYDPYTRSFVVGLGAVRSTAEQKIANRQVWHQWSEQYMQVGKLAQGALRSAEAEFSKAPPCLTKAETDYRQAINWLDQLLTIVADRPDEALGRVAKNMSDKLPVSPLLDQLNRMIDHAGQRVNEINGLTPELEKRIQRLEDFAKSGRPLTVGGNRKTLQRLIEDAEAIDSCHPKVTGYRALLSRF